MKVWIGPVVGFELNGILLSPESDASIPNQLSSMQFRFYADGKCIHKGRATFLDLRSPHERFSKKVRSLVRAKEEFLRETYFASTMNSLQDYRNLVEDLGRRRAKLVLSALHDVGFTKMQHARSAWYLKFLASSDLQRMLLRSSETMFAFARLGDIFFQEKTEQLSAASDTLSVECQLRGFSQPHRLDFRWSAESIVPRSWNVIIGENGTGKTQALFAIAESVAAVYSDSFSNADFSRVILMGASWGSRKLRLIADSMPCWHVIPPANGRVKICQLLSDLFVSEDGIAGKNRLDIAIAAFETVLDVSQVGVLTKNKSWHSILEISDIQKKYSGRKRVLFAAQIAAGTFGYSGAFDDFSSGHMQYMWLVLNLCAHVENGSLVLIDEPELHLHPRLIGQLILQIGSVLKNTGSFAIAATHSAYVVRELPADCVIQFIREGSSISIGRPTLRTFGADVGLIAYLVFDDEVVAWSLDLISGRLRAIKRSPESIKSDISISAMSALVEDYSKGQS